MSGARAAFLAAAAGDGSSTARYPRGYKRAPHGEPRQKGGCGGGPAAGRSSRAAAQLGPLRGMAFFCSFFRLFFSFFPFKESLLPPSFQSPSARPGGRSRDGGHE